MMDFITEAEVAEKIGVPVKKAAEWRLRYKWPHLKIGRLIRYTESDVEAIKRIHHVDGDKPTALPGQTALSAARSR